MGFDNLMTWVIIWIIAVIIYFAIILTKKRHGVGLGLMYVFSLTFGHFFGGLIYALPWYTGNNYLITKVGFILTTQGLIAFIVGSTLGADLLQKTMKFKWLRSKEYTPNKNLPFAYIIFALIAQIILGTILRHIPTISSFLTLCGNIIITGLCLASFQGWQKHKISTINICILISFLYPFISMAFSGFLGFGACLSITLLLFIGSFYRPKWQVLVGILTIFYLGISLNISYLQQRSVIRESAWSEDNSLTAKMKVTIDALSKFQFINLTDQTQSWIIDERLNQNWLIGQAVSYLSYGSEPYANGKTLSNAALALIPRIIWPDKPIKAGGGNLVTQYTGIEFAENTTVGMGQIFEFYINFGKIGVWVGLFIWGTLVGLIDIAARNRLDAGNWDSFVRWFLMGQSFNLMLSAITECVMFFGLSLAFVLIINESIRQFLKLKKRRRIIYTHYQNNNVE